MATGGDDNQIKIWDLRKKSCVHIVPAHFKLVSSINFEADEGKYMVSTSYDGRCKIWNTRDWTYVVALTGYESKLSSAAVSRDTKYIITTSFDRTFRLWERKKEKTKDEPEQAQAEPKEDVAMSNEQS